MKRHFPIFFFAALFLVIGFLSCKKINEATELGGDLIPVVDNVNTFEVALSAISNNQRFNIPFSDTTKVFYDDFVALGATNDPEFGQVDANFHFNILPATLGIYPFLHKDSVRIIDSVVLSLAYQGGYGDTANASQSLSVYEIDPNSGFHIDSIYKYADPTSDFATTGGVLGSKTYNLSSLKDSMVVVTGNDTAKVANVVRIKLDNSFAARFEASDTTASGAYHSDSSRGDNFRRLFAGFAIKSDNGGNVLSYFDLSNTDKTNLTFYFRIIHSNGSQDTLASSFIHSTNGQANYVKVTPGANWATYLTNGTESDDKIYIQSAPSGSYASILIPDLSTLGNKIIHRAELIAPKLPSAMELTFTPPTKLFLDKTNLGTPDSAFLFNRDIAVGFDGSLDLASFGGTLKNNEYRFNITRYVQGIITRNEPNDTLRLYAPLRTAPYIQNPSGATRINVQVAPAIAYGRVVLGGGSYVNPDQRLRLRIVYSNL